MRVRTVLASVAAMLIAAAATVMTAQPAAAWGDASKCAGHTTVQHTNRWSSPFAGHNMDVTLRACYTIGTRSVPPHWLWTARPKVTYPSKITGGIFESVSTSIEPFLSSVHLSSIGQVPDKVTYHWQVKQCSLVRVLLCQNFTFRVTYYLIAGSKICFVGGACDDYKRW